MRGECWISALWPNHFCALQSVFQESLEVLTKIPPMSLQTSLSGAITMQNLWDFSHPSSYLWLWSPPSQSWCPSAQSASCRHCLFPEVLGFRQTQEEIVFLPPWDPGEWGLCPSHSFCPCFGPPLLKFSVVSRTPVKPCFQDGWVNWKQLLCNAGGSFQPVASRFTSWVLSLVGQETECFALMGPIFWPHPWVPHLSFLLVVMFGRQGCLLLKEIPILKVGITALWV